MCTLAQAVFLVLFYSQNLRCSFGRLLRGPLPGVARGIPCPPLTGRLGRAMRLKGSWTPRGDDWRVLLFVRKQPQKLAKQHFAAVCLCTVCGITFNLL